MVSCGDLKRKCEIDCLLPTPETSIEYSWPKMKTMPYEKISSCTDMCGSDYDDCSETDDAMTALSCSYECATEYEGKLLACMQGMNAAKIGTVDDTMDDCANDASLVMNVCSETCHDEDVYGGWSEAAEEGISEDAMPEFMSNSKTVKVPDYRAGIPSYKATGKVVPADVMLAAIDKNSETETSIEIVQKLGVGGVMGLSGLFAGSVLAIGLFVKRTMEPSRYQHETL